MYLTDLNDWIYSRIVICDYLDVNAETLFLICVPLLCFMGGRGAKNGKRGLGNTKA